MIFLWILNFGISILNAIGCGMAWNDTRQAGGFAHFMNWMGAIMAAVGFTWCYLILFGAVATVIPITDDDGNTAPLLSGESLEALYNLGYLMIIGPAIGSGLAITVNSWMAFAKRRSFGDGMVAGWNTYAQVSNTMSAIQHVPEVSSSLGDFFKSDKDNKGAVVIVLAAVALFGGILTTWGIISMIASKRSRAF